VKLLAELVARALQLTTTLLLARGLGAAEFGTFGVLSAVAVVAAEAADLGLQGTATRALVAGTLPLRGLLRAKAWLSGGFLLATLLVWPLWPMLTPLLLYFAGAGWAEILGVVLRARGRRLQEAALIVLLRLAGLALVAVALRGGGGAMACAWALALSTLPASLVGGILVRRGASGPLESPVDPGPAAVLRLSAPLAVNGGLALLSLRVELLVMSGLRSPEEVGYFIAALQVVQVLNFVPNALMAGAMPALTREALGVLGGSSDARRGRPEEGGGDGVRRRAVSLVAFAAAPAAVGLVLVAPALTAWLYDRPYAPTAAPLAVLGLGVVPLFLNAVFTHALIAAEQARTLPRLTLVRVVLAALLAALLVPLAGGPGAAAGFCLSELILLALGAQAARRAGFAVAVSGPTVLALLVTLPMAIVVYPVREHLFPALAAGGLAYLVTVLLTGAALPRVRRDLGYP
jgi:O-antigen/teichoic acid export membrane protein